MPASRNPLSREVPWNAPSSLTRRHEVKAVDDEYEPVDLEEAAQFVLNQQPAEVAAYSDHVTQASVAREIASVIFRRGIPIGENYTRWLAGEQPIEPIVSHVPPAVDSAEALRQKFAATEYRTTSTPIEAD